MQNNFFMYFCCISNIKLKVWLFWIAHRYIGFVCISYSIVQQLWKLYFENRSFECCECSFRSNNTMSRNQLSHRRGNINQSYFYRKVLKFFREFNIVFRIIVSPINYSLIGTFQVFYVFECRVCRFIANMWVSCLYSC